MTETPTPRTGPADDGRPRVVVGIDGSRGARGALRSALLEAARRHARLDVVAAYPVVLAWTGGMPVDVPDLPRVREDTRDRARGFLDEVRAELAGEEVPGPGDVPVHLVVTGGPAADVLVHRAQGADLLVVGSRGRGELRSALLGSVALHCATHAPCPVMVVHGAPDAGPDRARRVVVGLDGSDTSVTALREAVAEAGRLGADLDVVVAYSLADMWTDLYSAVIPTLGEIRARVRDEADRLVERITAEQGPGGDPVPHVHVELFEGIAREALLERAAGADLLVVGSRSHGAVRGMLLGSVALHCMVHAPCTVVVVHPQDRPAPAERAVQPAAARG
jgi:nucleotide-binding universal stress UspA family protein